jgi:hypothetical protein
MDWPFLAKDVCLYPLPDFWRELKSNNKFAEVCIVNAKLQLRRSTHPQILQILMFGKNAGIGGVFNRMETLS